LLRSIPQLIKEALEVLPEIIPRAHGRARGGFLSPLPVPSTWNDDIQ
jgi:hypothetical protein